MAKTTYAKGINGLPILAERAKKTAGGQDIDTALGALDAKTVPMTSEEFAEIVGILDT